jgi:hypothetical protein
LERGEWVEVDGRVEKEDDVLIEIRSREQVKKEVHVLEKKKDELSIRRWAEGWDEEWRGVLKEGRDRDLRGERDEDREREFPKERMLLSGRDDERKDLFVKDKGS